MNDFGFGQSPSDSFPLPDNSTQIPVSPITRRRIEVWQSTIPGTSESHLDTMKHYVKMDMDLDAMGMPDTEAGHHHTANEDHSEFYPADMARSLYGYPPPRNNDMLGVMPMQHVASPRSANAVAAPDSFGRSLGVTSDNGLSSEPVSSSGTSVFTEGSFTTASTGMDSEHLGNGHHRHHGFVTAPPYGPAAASTFPQAPLHGHGLTLNNAGYQTLMPGLNTPSTLGFGSQPPSHAMNNSAMVGTTTANGNGFVRILPAGHPSQHQQPPALRIRVPAPAWDPIAEYAASRAEIMAPVREPHNPLAYLENMPIGSDEHSSQSMAGTQSNHTSSDPTPTHQYYVTMPSLRTLTASASPTDSTWDTNDTQDSSESLVEFSDLVHTHKFEDDEMTDGPVDGIVDTPVDGPVDDPFEVAVANGMVDIDDLPETTTSGSEIRNADPRSHELYRVTEPEPDGFFHCPWLKKGVCDHAPVKLKCAYDKYIDSHLRPFRCRNKKCHSVRFSSMACQLRHERERHGMHGHGAKPYKCLEIGCPRVADGFPRQFNRLDHMRRVHNWTPEYYYQRLAEIEEEEREAALQDAYQPSHANSVAPQQPRLGNVPDARRGSVEGRTRRAASRSLGATPIGTGLTTRTSYADETPRRSNRRQPRPRGSNRRHRPLIRGPQDDEPLPNDIVSPTGPVSLNADDTTSSLPQAPRPNPFRLGLRSNSTNNLPTTELPSRPRSSGTASANGGDGMTAARPYWARSPKPEPESPTNTRPALTAFVAPHPAQLNPSMPQSHTNDNNTEYNPLNVAPETGNYHPRQPRRQYGSQLYNPQHAAEFPADMAYTARVMRLREQWEQNYQRAQQLAHDAPIRGPDDIERVEPLFQLYTRLRYLSQQIQNLTGEGRVWLLQNDRSQDPRQN